MVGAEPKSAAGNDDLLLRVQHRAVIHAANNAIAAGLAWHSSGDGRGAPSRGLTRKSGRFARATPAARATAASHAALWAFMERPSLVREGVGVCAAQRALRSGAQLMPGLRSASHATARMSRYENKRLARRTKGNLVHTARVAT